MPIFVLSSSQFLLSSLFSLHLIYHHEPAGLLPSRGRWRRRRPLSAAERAPNPRPSSGAAQSPKGLLQDQEAAGRSSARESTHGCCCCSSSAAASGESEPGTGDHLHHLAQGHPHHHQRLPVSGPAPDRELRLVALRQRSRLLRRRRRFSCCASGFDRED